MSIAVICAATQPGFTDRRKTYEGSLPGGYRTQVTNLGVKICHLKVKVGELKLRVEELAYKVERLETPMGLTRIYWKRGWSRWSHNLIGRKLFWIDCSAFSRAETHHEGTPKNCSFFKVSSQGRLTRRLQYIYIYLSALIVVMRDEN